jgi:hypothetical protein
MSDGKVYSGPPRRPLPSPGRPQKITDEMCEAVRAFDADRVDDKIIMRKLDIGRTTLWRVRKMTKDVSKPLLDNFGTSPGFQSDDC